MCGIAGAFAYSSDAAPVDRAELRAVRDHMAARGPDGAGEWYSSDNRVGLAHRRLSIIDLSERGAQPMASADGRLVVTFNGEIYNYPQLRKSLEASGVQFRSDSDTEVLLHLFAAKGPDMLRDLRGMYAFAIWDARDQSLLLARDPFGIKPLYYSDNGKALRFASQVKALLKAAVDTTPEPAGHAGFFLWGSVPEPWTLYRGIRALPAGCYVRIDAAGLGAPVCHTSVSGILRSAAEHPATGDRHTALEAIAAAVKESVRAHQLADVPIGVFLSAGIDSPMIALAMVGSSSELRTLTLGFREYVGMPQDEVPLAEAVARQVGSRHTTVMVSREDFASEREKLLAAMDQPSIDGVNSWFVSRAAAQCGLKVAMSGLGGDELFASYPSFTDIPKLVRATRYFAQFPQLGRITRTMAAPLLSHFASPKYAGLLEYGGTLAGAYQLRRWLFMPWELSKVMPPEMAEQGLKDLQTTGHLAADAAGNGSMRLSISALEMSWYMRNQLLRDADWAGMAHSLEIRTPFVDIKLLESTAPWLAAHPDIAKREVAEAVAPKLAREILNRPKTGFTVPVRDWLNANDSNKAAPPGRGLRGWASTLYDLQGLARPGETGMRILLLTTDAYGGHGGIALYNRDLIEALVSMPEVDAVDVVPRNIRFDVADIPPKVNFFSADAGSKLRFIRRALQLAARKPEIVICGHINLLPVAAIVAAICRRPLVLMVYGIDVWTQPYRSARLWLRKCTAVWSISDITKQRMNEWARLPDETYKLLPNAIHLDQYGEAPRSVELLRQHRVPVDATLLLTVARLVGAERYKGVDEVIAVMPMLLEVFPRLHYVVVGDGGDLPRLQRLVAVSGLQDRVTFVGLATDPDKVLWYQSADVFVMPGRGEGFGFVYLEALACGTPAVGSQIDGSREALRGGALGELVDPRDINSVYDGVQRVLRSGDRGVPSGLSYFAWPTFVERLRGAVARVEVF